MHSEQKTRKMIACPLIKKGPKLPSVLFSACCNKISLVVSKLSEDCIFTGLLLRPRSAWGAGGTADLSAKTMSRKRCVILILQTYLLSSSASAEHCKQGLPIASISVPVFLKSILITETVTKITVTLILVFM